MRSNEPGREGELGERLARALHRLAPGKTTGNGAEMPAAVPAGIVP
jgi:hypothetical protein